MGFWPVNTVTVTRIFNPRQIVVSWKDAIEGEKQERFEFDETEKAFALADGIFKELCM